ncbi:MAG: hypothetical protein ACJ768_25520 [Gaiellaceae bacterium]
MTRLWHYTCDDGAPLITAAGVLLPRPHPWLPEPVTWATDLLPGDVPNLDLALGVRGAHATCDRTAHRFEVVDVDEFEPWTQYARRQTRAGLLSPAARERLDSTPGGFPRHWWLSTRPARVAIIGADV